MGKKINEIEEKFPELLDVRLPPQPMNQVGRLPSIWDLLAEEELLLYGRDIGSKEFKKWILNFPVGATGDKSKLGKNPSYSSVKALMKGLPYTAWIENYKDKSLRTAFSTKQIKPAFFKWLNQKPIQKPIMKANEYLEGVPKEVKRKILKKQREMDLKFYEMNMVGPQEEALINHQDKDYDSSKELTPGVEFFIGKGGWLPVDDRVD